MLPRRRRVTAGEDYRATVRKGARAGTPGLVASAVLHHDPATPTRFGFIISKRVGVAVVRNRTRRRLKAICAELAPELERPTGTASGERALPGLDIVIRVHPEAGGYDWPTLREQARSAIRRAARRAREEGRSR